MWLDVTGKFQVCRHCCDLSVESVTVPVICWEDSFVFVGSGLLCLEEEEKKQYKLPGLWSLLTSVKKVYFRSKTEKYVIWFQVAFISCHLVPSFVTCLILLADSRGDKARGGVIRKMPQDAPLKPHLLVCQWQTLLGLTRDSSDLALLVC